MIPKKIHYCWFGRNPLPKLAQKCIKSWKKYCPDYEIIEWNEDNYDLSAAPLYVQQAYEAKKWAFVTDYVRPQVVYEHGGIYLDTDVELIKNIDKVLGAKGFFAFENGTYIATGLGFGATKRSELVREMMDVYLSIPFVKEDGSFDVMPCPARNTDVLLKHGLKQDDSLQCLDGYMVYPHDWFCPCSWSTGEVRKTKNTLGIHWFSSSWYASATKVTKSYEAKRIKRINRRHFIKTLPNRALMFVMGEKRYSRLKAFVGKVLQPKSES